MLLYQEIQQDAFLTITQKARQFIDIMKEKPMPKIQEPTTPDASRTLKVKNYNDQPPEALVAHLVTDGLFNNAIVVTEFSKSYMGDDVSLTRCMEALQEKTEAIYGNDMKNMETLLMSQALALDTMFAALARRAKLTLDHHIDMGDKVLRLALKAQSQCRTTLETLANIKNPQPYIQHNRAQYQQVNNGATLPPEALPARENQKQTNELLDALNAPERLDFSATQATIQSHQDMEAVATQHRPQNP